MPIRLIIALLTFLLPLAAPVVAQQEVAPAQPEATEAPQVAPAAASDETQPVAKAMPPLEPVIGHIPADAIAFVIVKDIGAMTADLDKYLSDVGLAPLLVDKMPDGVLGAAKSAAMLGEGFNPNGGFAAVLLPLEKFGVDIDKLMPSPTKGDGQEADTETQPAAEQKLPFLILVPGASVGEVFGNYEQAPAGKYTEVSLRMGKMLAGQAGGYVALSPRADVLDSLASMDKDITSRLDKEQAEFVAKSLVTIHVDFSAAAGTMEKLFQKFQANLASDKKAVFARQLQPMILAQQQILSQLSTMTAGLRLSETGLVGEAMVAYKPDSEIGKALAAVTAPATVPLNRLPNLPYVLAYGAGAQDGKTLAATQQKSGMEILDKMMQAGAFPGMDEKSLNLLKELITVTNEEISEMQFVMGGAPEGSGLVGLAVVIRCQNSTRLKNELVDKTIPLANQMIEKAIQDKKRQSGAEALAQAAQQAAETAPTEQAEAESKPATEPAEPKVQLVVSKAADNIDGVSVDVVEIALPPDTQEQVAGQLTTLLGQDKLQILLAAPDEKTVVMTLGGAKAMMAETIRTAKAADGTIPSEEGTVEAMKHLPGNLMGIGLLNVGNLSELIGKIAAAMAPEGSQSLPFQITAKTPIAFGVSVTGATQHMAFYVPTELVREVSGIAAMFMGAAPPPMQEAPSEPDSSQPQQQEEQGEKGSQQD